MSFFPEVKSAVTLLNPGAQAIVTGAVSDIFQARPDISRREAHQRWPDRYEYYEIEVQVLDLQLPENPVIASFNFSVLPQSLSIQKTYQTNVIKTFTDIFVHDNFTFTPINLSFRGTFGHRHKAQILLYTRPEISGVPQVSFLTGFGLIKRLERIIELTKSTNLDGYPLTCVLINRAFSQVLVVEFLNVTYVANDARQSMWDYEFTVRAVRDGSNLVTVVDDVETYIKKFYANKAGQMAAERINQVVASTLNFVF